MKKEELRASLNFNISLFVNIFIIATLFKFLFKT